MNLSPIVWVETGAACLLALGFLWTKPEYGLFFYALALGFPDLAFPLGDTINIRADDIILISLLPRIFLWTPAPATPGQRRVFGWQGLFLAICLLSVAVESTLGDPPGGYETAKMIGCAIIFLGLPRVVQSKRRLRFFINGLMCGGIALVTQVFLRLGGGSASAFANVQELKSAATFSTWNPNTIGQAAVLLAFAAGLGAVLISERSGGKFLWLWLATGFALVPALMFIRGTSLSLAAGFILFFCLSRRWNLAMLFILVCLSVFFYLHVSDRRLAEEATSVNLKTGEGFSHRFERWSAAYQGIQTSPITGHGFGQEGNYLTLLGSEGRAHNAYLTVWLELGIGGLLIFLAAVFQFARGAFLLFKNPRFQTRGALILSLIVTLSIDSFGLPTLYWEKLPTIALSLALIVIGMSEREVQPIVESEAAQLSYATVMRPMLRPFSSKPIVTRRVW